VRLPSPQPTTDRSSPRQEKTSAGSTVSETMPRAASAIHLELFLGRVTRYTISFHLAMLLSAGLTVTWRSQNVTSHQEGTSEEHRGWTSHRE